MALDSLVSSFALETSGAGGTQAITGVGFTPKALILFTTGQTTLNATQDNYLRAVGFATATEEGSTAEVVVDGGTKGTTKAYRAHSNNSVIWTPLASGSTPDVEFSVSSFDSDGFTLNKDNIGAARQFIFLALGGSDITNAFVKNFTSKTSSGTQAYTGVGAEPDLILFAATDTSSLETTNGAGLFSFGVATASAEWAVGASIDIANPGQANSILDTSNCFHAPYQDSTHLAFSLDSMDSDGFTLDYTTHNTTARNISALCLTGVSVAVGTETAVTTTPATKQTTTTGISPGALILAGVNSATTGSVINGDSSICLGISDGSNDAAAWSGSRDNSGSTYNSSRALSDTAVYTDYDEDSSSPTLVRSATVDAVASGSFTLDWTTVNGTAAAFGYLAIDGTAALPSVDAVWSGAVTSTTADVSAVISDSSSAVVLEVDNNSDFSSVTFTSSSSSTTSVGGAGDVVKIQATGLTADTGYYYRIKIDGNVATGGSGEFTTAPTAYTAKSFTVAIGACSRDDAQTPNNTVFDEVASSGAAFFAHLGDMHYADLTSSATLTQHNAALMAHRNIAKVADMYRALPMVYTRDDHDSGPNNSDMATSGWSTIQNRSLSAYESQVPHYPLVDFSSESPFENGIAQTWDWGRVRFIMPDMRTFADDTDQTLLGDGATHHSLVTADQEAWLASLITTTSTDVANGDIALVVLLSSRGWIEGTFGGGTWEGEWPTYQATFAEAVADADLPFVIFSGDVHAIAAEDGAGTDFTSGKGRIPNVVTGPMNGLGYITSGPYDWQGVANNAPATGGSEEHQYVLLTITDTAGVLTWSVQGFDESGASVMSAKSSADDTPELNFTSSTATVSEAAGTVEITVEKDWFDACSCSYATADGTASAGTDYTNTSGTVTWLGVGNNQTISVPITNRGGTQGDRTFTITISSGSGATIGATNVVTVTIQDAIGGGSNYQGLSLLGVGS